MFIVIWSCLTEFNELVTVVLPHWINRAVEAEARADKTEIRAAKEAIREVAQGVTADVR